MNSTSVNLFLGGNSSAGLGGNYTKGVLPLTETAYLIWKIFPPILLFLGTIGNILSIVVLGRRSMRRSGVCMYLICLGVADLLVLYTGLLRNWVKYTFYVDIRELHPLLCKLNTWLVYVSLDLSAWILVSVTVERAISVWRPHKVKVICTRKVFVANIVGVVVLLLLINGHYLIGLGDLVFGGQIYPCSNLSRPYAHFLSYVFPWIDLCFFCIGPFLFHAVGNGLIVTRLAMSMRSLSQYQVGNREQMEERKRQVSSMTTMLLSLNVVYLICTLPISVYLIYTGYWELDQSPEAAAKRDLVYACVNLLMYLNNSTNFITYAVSGKRFRSELYSLFCGSASRIRSTATISSSVTSNSARSRTQGSTRTTSVV